MRISGRSADDEVDMPLGLHARFVIDPRTILRGGWSHDLANALCRAKLRIEREYLEASPASQSLGR